MKHMTVKQALHYVSDNPVQLSDEPTQLPAYELVARALFKIANSPDSNTRGSMAAANKARKMLMERLVGRRRAGTRPATREEIPIEFHDLTQGALDS